jgi:hypothetical protein
MPRFTEDEFAVEVVVKGTVRRWFLPNGVSQRFDWILPSSGLESDMTFETAQEAADDFYRRFA